jgi:hypothetical protein
MLVMKFIKRNVELQDEDGNKKIFKCVFEKRRPPSLPSLDEDLEVWVAVMVNGRPVEVESHSYFYHPDTGKVYTL